MYFGHKLNFCNICLKGANIIYVRTECGMISLHDIFLTFKSSMIAWFTKPASDFFFKFKIKINAFLFPNLKNSVSDSETRMQKNALFLQKMYIIFFKIRCLKIKMQTVLFLILKNWSRPVDMYRRCGQMHIHYSGWTDKPQLTQYW